MAKSIAEKKIEAEFKAWDALSRYKFLMFGYWAAIWVHLNQIDQNKSPNPWSDLVNQAKEVNAALKQDFK